MRGDEVRPKEPDQRRIRQYHRPLAMPRRRRMLSTLLRFQG